MATYFGTSINESPTVILEAGAKLENVQGIALAITAGKLARTSLACPCSPTMRTSKLAAL